ATAARLLGRGSPLADALEMIDQRRAPALAVSPVMAPMYIINPLAGRPFTTLFSTHPPVRERVRRLRAYDNARTSPPRHARCSALDSRADTSPIAMVRR